MCLGAWQRAGVRGRNGGALSCVGGLFRLGFGKLLHEHVETPNLFHPQCSQGTTALPLLLIVHVVKMLLPCLFSSPLHPPPTALLLFSLLFACSPCLCSPPPHIHFYVLLVYILLCGSRAGCVCVCNFSPPLNVRICG